MVLGVISGRLAPDFPRYGPGYRVDTNRQYVVSHIVGFDGDRRRGTGREGERAREKYKENVGAWIQALGFSVRL
jgi:hypothetical protein